MTKSADTTISTMTAEEEPLTKRAKRKQPNTKNLWVANAPKIQSSNARAANYLRVAGLHPSSIDKTKSITLDPDSPVQKFGRLLGGTDQRIRHQAVLQLRAYLKQRCGGNHDNVSSGLSQLELLKLWKCLWHTLYMADQVPVQQELANHLSKLIWCVAGTEEEDEYAAQIYLDMCMQQEAMEEEEEALYDDDDEEEDDDDASDEEVAMQEVYNKMDKDDDEVSSDEDEWNDSYEVEEDDEESVSSETDLSEVPHRRGAHLAHLFLKCLLSTVQREWGNMDKYRIDKFYTLLRLVLRQVYEYMAQRHWNLGIIRLFNDVIIDEVLSQTPNGMRLHFIDICVDELAAANASAPMPLTEPTFLDVLEPYFSIAQTGAGGDDSLHQRAVEKVLIKFLKKYSFVAEEQGDDVPIFDQVHVETIAQFIFELASDGTTKDKYRKTLYDVHKQYMRRLKEVGRDVELNAVDDTDDIEAGSDETDADLDENDKVVTVVEEVEEHAKSSKKKKRKKNKEVESTSPKELAPLLPIKVEKEAVASAPVDDSHDDDVDEKKSEKKSKKKKKKKRKSVGDDGERQPEAPVKAEEETTVKAEEEIMISLKDQKLAKKAMSEEKKKKSKKLDDDKASSDTECDGKRRVKFGELNRARSWTASMRGLRDNEPQAHKVATPEKGILLNKHTPIPIAKGKRKKAVDYF
ncbi:hypothetical protein MPSEU_000814100 [Mayamaea pseudoterrestris]|nr:hypothetical protein MPSEU_000814100 [Mayamaea pseudoterrestris]